MADLSPLRRRMIEDMTVRNLSPSTQRSYVSAVSKFSRYFGRSPDKLGLDEVRDFQVHLVSRGVPWGSLNQIVCALRFFYGVTLNEAIVPERIPYVRTPRKLPVVLSTDEVVRFLEAVSSLKSRAALTTAYAAGLRASEVAGLLIEDIDSGRGVIRVRQGKGATAIPACPHCGGIMRIIGCMPHSFHRPTCAGSVRETSPKCSILSPKYATSSHRKSAGTTSRLQGMSQVKGRML